MRFNKSDRISMLLIFMVIIGIWLGVIIDRLLLRNEQELKPLESYFGHVSPLADAIDSVALSDSLYMAREEEHARRYEDESSDTPPRKIETFAFDPNTADSSSLLRLGLAPWQVRSILKYRSKGGRYHTVKDFQRVPGMTPEVWNRLAPVMQIGEAFRYYHDRKDSSSFSTKPDTSYFPRQEKYQEIVQLNINQVDTTSLKKIPGIGSFRARQIIRYRDKLGGFVSLDQLGEIEGLPEGLDKWFKIETGVFRRLRINSLSVGDLARHPYVNYAQARAILAYRRNYGNIKSLGELRLLDEFTEDDFKRLEPYVEY